MLDLDVVEQAAMVLYGKEHDLPVEAVAAAFEAAGWRTRTRYRARVIQGKETDDG